MTGVNGGHWFYPWFTNNGAIHVCKFIFPFSHSDTYDSLFNIAMEWFETQATLCKIRISKSRLLGCWCHLLYNVFPSTNFFTYFLLILDVLALTGLAVGIPVRYFLLGDDQQAQRKLVLAKQRPADFSYGTEFFNGQGIAVKSWHSCDHLWVWVGVRVASYGFVWIKLGETPIPSTG